MHKQNTLITLSCSLLLGLIVCFFLSIFANLSYGYHQYNDQHWFLVNRGYPRAWAGTSVPGRDLPWFLVKAPLVKATYSYQGNHQTWDKVIDITRFLPLLLLSSVCTVPFTWLLVRAGQRNTSIRKAWQGTFIFSVFILLFLYFFWFPRI